jgi:TrmH family RNA methyltransferase
LIALTAALFEKVSTREGPDGILAIGKAWVKRLEDIQFKKDPLFLMVEGVEKPGNLGALMRSAESAGVEALILCAPVIDPLSPSVIRNSQGAVFTIPFVEASQAEVVAFFKAHGVTTVATTPAASTLYWEAELRGPLAILMGSEKAGLTPFWLSQADLQVKIPLMGAADSLNLATAAVLTLYEALRQRLPR